MGEGGVRLRSAILSYYLWSYSSRSRSHTRSHTRSPGLGGLVKLSGRQSEAGVSRHRRPRAVTGKSEGQWRARRATASWARGGDVRLGASPQQFSGAGGLMKLSGRRSERGGYLATVASQMEGGGRTLSLAHSLTHLLPRNRRLDEGRSPPFMRANLAPPAAAHSASKFLAPHAGVRWKKERSPPPPAPPAPTPNGSCAGGGIEYAVGSRVIGSA